MSKIKLTGSNSGYVEIASAADAGNLTLTLPTGGTALLSNGDNVYTGITTFSNDFKLEGASYDVVWDKSDNQLEFGANAKLSFGASSDMQLYHDGNHSYIADAGTGNLRLRSGTLEIQNLAGSKTSAVFSSGGGQTLNFNNNTKFVTTNTGTIVTGIGTFSGRVGVGTNTTAERNSLPAPKAGHLIMNATTNLLEYYNGSAWTPIDTPPTVTSVNNSNILESQIASGFDLVITGTNFKSGATATFVGNDGTEHISPTVTVNTTTQITARVHGSVSNANEPYDVKIGSPSGLAGTLEDAFNVNAKPAWTTGAGIITTIGCNATGIHTTIAATDPEGDTITYSGTVGGGLSLNSSTGAISGDPTDVSSSTTLSFTANATSSGQATPRSFSVVVTPEPVLSNLEVWFDPRNFSSLANNATASSNSASNTNATWTLTTDGSAGFISGMNNQGIECTSGSKVQFHTKNQDVTAFDGVDNFTFEFWIYMGGNLGTWGFVGGKSDFWASNHAGIYIKNTGTAWGFHTEGNFGIEQTLPSSGWYHLVAVRNLADANCRKLYVNNSVVAEDNGGDNNSAHTLNNDCALTIGGDSNGNANNFNTPGYPLTSGWKFGHTRFYTAALSATQITQNWNAERSIYGL